MNSQIGVFTTDVNLVVRAWDAWLERATGRAAVEVCGKSLTDLFPDLQTRGLLATFRRAIEQGSVELVSSALHGYLIECPVQAPSQKFKFMQQRAVIAPIRDTDHVTGLLVTIEDVTVRREDEAEPGGHIAHEDWRVRKQAVQESIEEPGDVSIAALVQRLKQEHRDPSLLNSVLQMLASGRWETVQPLIELSRDADSELRMYAALALGDLRDRRAIPTLMQLLRDDADANVRYHAIDALSKLKAAEAVDDLAGIAQSGDFFLAFPALDALAAIGEPRVATQIVPLLENDMLRSAAIGALAQLGDEKMVVPMVALMERPPLSTVVAEALETLHERYEKLYDEGQHIIDLVHASASATAAQNLLDALNRATGKTLHAVLRVLGWIGTDNVLQRLTRLLGSPAFRNEAIEALVRHGQSVVQPLTLQMKTGDLDTRHAAVHALGRIGDPGSVPALIQALADSDLTVEAAGALAKIGDRRAYPALLPLLSDKSAAVRQAAIGALNSLGDPRMRADIPALLTADNPHVRESAVRIAGYFGFANCSASLLERCHDSDEAVRRAAVENLPHVADESALPALTKAARDPSPKIRSAAAQSLAFMEGAQAFSELMRSLDDPHPWVRYYAARGLRQLANPESIDALARVLRTDSANQVRIAAADALGSIGGPRVVAILAPFVDSEDRDLAYASLIALGRVGHPDALQPIVGVLRSTDAAARTNAVRAVAARRDALAVEALQWTSAVDTDPEVSAAAIQELGAMGTAESITALIRLCADRRLREQAIDALVRLEPGNIQRVAAGLGNPEMEVRRAVVEALGRMKHPTASAILESALDDDRAEVRLAAIIAFRRLGSRIAERKLLLLSRNDPDPGIRKAAETALER